MFLSGFASPAAKWTGDDIEDGLALHRRRKERKQPEAGFAKELSHYALAPTIWLGSQREREVGTADLLV
jgi:hypothetical protein